MEYVFGGIVIACAIGIILLENRRIRARYRKIKSFRLYK